MFVDLDQNEDGFISADEHAASASGASRFLCVPTTSPNARKRAEDSSKWMPCGRSWVALERWLQLTMRCVCWYILSDVRWHCSALCQGRVVRSQTYLRTTGLLVVRTNNGRSCAVRVGEEGSTCIVEPVSGGRRSSDTARRPPTPASRLRHIALCALHCPVVRTN